MKEEKEREGEPGEERNEQQGSGAILMNATFDCCLRLDLI